MQNTIERQITVKATMEEVYEAISNPKQLTQWFPNKVEGSLEVGEQAVFMFTEANHKTRVYIEAAKPYEYFAFRWVPGGAASLVDDVLKSPNTLVEFKIEESPEGTNVTLRESGFAALPREMAEASFNDNSGGWEYMMGRLEKVMNQK